VSDPYIQISSIEEWEVFINLDKCSDDTLRNFGVNPKWDFIFKGSIVYFHLTQIQSTMGGVVLAHQTSHFESMMNYHVASL
jgi:hypothetical protein